MNKYPKEFLMRIAEKEEDLITKTYILCINDLLGYDFEYLKKSGIIQLEFCQAIEAIATVSRNYDDVKEVFDLMIDNVKRKGDTDALYSYIEEIANILIEGDKDKYEEYILNKLFGDVWKDPDFFLPEKNFLGLSDRLPTLGDLLFHNTTFSDNISEELSKKIIKGLKLLYDTIPGLIDENFHYEEGSAFPECSVTKYIKQDLKLKQSCKMENAINVKISKDYIQVVKYIFIHTTRYKYQDELAKKITQQFSKMRGISISESSLTITLEREERINLPVNFIL